MSSKSSVVGLSKYIRHLPKIKKTIFLILISTFILIIISSLLSGFLNFIINPEQNSEILKRICYRGIGCLLVLGVGTILGGVIQSYAIDFFKGINIKMKHSLFISFLSLLLIIFIILIGLIATFISKNIYLTNTLILGCVLIFGLNTLIFKSGTTLNYVKSTIVGIIQPAIILGIYLILIMVRTNNTFNITLFLIKIFISAVIILIAVYGFLYSVEAPMKKNLGMDVLELISRFIAYTSHESKSIETVFDKMSATVETVVSFVSFRNKDGIKCLFISPFVHPGPLGEICGGNMPTILSEKFDNFTMVAHGPSTHDLNPISTKEIDKIETAIKKGLDKINYSSKASEFVRYGNNKSKIGIQFFNEGMVVLSTFAPEDSDDIEFGVGLNMMLQSKKKCNVKDSVIVDCHNSFTPESGGVLPGNKEVFEIIELIDNIKTMETYESIKVGTFFDEMADLNTNEGVGQSGVKIMVIEVNNQKTAYILFDSNNMEKGFREEIMDSLKDFDIDEIEIMTSDTHFVNNLTRGYNPIGLSEREKIINYVKMGVKEAIADLEEVEVGTGTEKISDLKTFGPNNSTELISTASATIASSKITAPTLFISAFILIFVYIFEIVGFI